jgi:DNA-binding IclR family transcriptional regulator
MGAGGQLQLPRSSRGCGSLKIRPSKGQLSCSFDLGLATVYRVLAQFEQAGLLKKSQLGAGRAAYELNDGEQHHGHLVSLVDGAVHKFFDPRIEERPHLDHVGLLAVASNTKGLVVRSMTQPAGARACIRGGSCTTR